MVRKETQDQQKEARGSLLCHAIGEEEHEINDEAFDKDEELQAWCLLEERANMSNGKSSSAEETQKLKTAIHASQLSEESNPHLSCKKIIEVKDRWVKVRVTVDSGVAGHVMIEIMFPLETRAQDRTDNFQAVHGEQNRGLGHKTIPCKTHEEGHRCVTYRSASGVKPSQCRTSSELETLW